jgi:plasmid stabilization system protein ParE
MAYRLAKRAEADLDDIAYYIAMESGSLEVAERVIDAITGRFPFLANHPYSGRAETTIWARAVEASRLISTSSSIG